MIAAGKLSSPLAGAAAAFLALLLATTAVYAQPPTNSTRASAAAKKSKPAKAPKGAPQKKTPAKPGAAPAGTPPQPTPAAPRTLAPEPPVDTSVPPPLLPRASRERMRACAEEWEGKKRAMKVGLPMWRDFATGCLTR